MSLEQLKSIFICLESVLAPITSLYVSYHQNKTTLDYNFSKYVIQLHNLTLGLLLNHK